MRRGSFACALRGADLRSDVVVAAQRVWLEVESERAVRLDAAIRRLADAATPTEPAGAVVSQRAARIAVARVAAALLDDERAAALPRGRAEAIEADEVRAAGPGTMRFLPQPRDVDWRGGRATGVYREVDGDLARLFAADRYLQAYLAAWPHGVATAWRESVAELDAGTRAGLAASDAALDLLLGAPVERGMPGVAGGFAWRDAVWLAQQPAGEPWGRRQRLFAELEPHDAGSVRDAFVAAARTLASEQPSGGLTTALPAAAWRRKGLAAARWLYLGLREIDSIGVVLCEADAGRRPTVLVEPRPRSFAALRFVYERLQRLQRCRGGTTRGIDASLRLLDDVQYALREQAAGREPDAALQHRLLAALLDHVRDTDAARDAVTELPGIDGPLRRARPRLVRLPVRWRGTTRHALALRLFVERQRADGTWDGPPWGAVPADVAANGTAGR